MDMKSDMDNKEWLDDYPALKLVNQNSPFTVPEGYFDELGERITSYIQLDELRSKTTGGFTVPASYFDDLNSNIQSRVNIEAITNAKDAGFAVPENYFDELSGNIESRVAIEVEGEGFAVPENYFETLADHIKARIQVEEAFEEADNNFAVPAGYFEQLNTAILDKTVKRDAELRRGVVRKLFATSAFKYAAAACFALIVGTGVFISQLGDDPATVHKNSFLHKQLSTVPLGDIQSYLDINNDATETQHTAAADGINVNDAGLNTALQDYVDSDQ